LSFLNELKRRNVLRAGAAYIMTAWLVIQVVETILPAFGFGDTAVRVVTIAFAIGLVPVLILAWVFEFTPEGLKREAEVDHDRPISRASSRKLDRAIIVVLTLALAWFAFDKFLIDPQPETEIETSIAVLPFSNRSAVPEDAFFVDGIHEDILTQLANLSGLEKVISRTSVGQYRDTAKSMMQIGRELGVANILEGGIQRAGNRIRINMQLIDAASDKHLWAETYDREMTAGNLFAIQSEITRQVVSALNGVLSEQDNSKLDRLPTSSLEAYGEFVLGRQEVAKRTVDGIDRAIVHFENAIEHDPAYAMAYAGLANSIHLRANYIRPRQDISEVSGQVESLIDKALSLNPLSGEAWAALGLLRKDQKNIEEAEEYYLKAIDLSPNYAAPTSGTHNF
jgi:TolB-like protein